MTSTTNQTAIWATTGDHVEVSVIDAWGDCHEIRLAVVRDADRPDLAGMAVIHQDHPEARVVLNSYNPPGGCSEWYAPEAEQTEVPSWPDRQRGAAAWVRYVGNLRDQAAAGDAPMGRVMVGIAGRNETMWDRGAALESMGRWIEAAASRGVMCGYTAESRLRVRLDTAYGTSGTDLPVSDALARGYEIDLALADCRDESGADWRTWPHYRLSWRPRVEPVA